jgi:hypothetical protein
MQTSLFRAFLWLLTLSAFTHAYSFTASVDRQTFMVGEKAVLSLQFCYDNLEEYTLEEPKLQYFKVLQLSEEEQKDDNRSCLLQRYALTATKEGVYTLPQLKAHIESIPKAYQTRYNRNHYLQKVDIFTKMLSLHILALPHGLQVTGDYQLFTHLDKTEVVAKKPIHFTVELKGKGNIENIDFLDLHIPNTLIYPHKTETLSKTFDIVSDTNYTIPSIFLTYFNQAHQMVEYIHTKCYNITVTQTSAQKSHSTWIMLLMTGIYLGLFFYLYSLFKQLAFIDEKKILFKRIKKAKNKKELLKVISPYMFESKGLERVVYRLEKSEESAFKTLKKETTTQMHLLTHTLNKFI